MSVAPVFGIEAIAAYVPRYCIDLDTLAKANNVDKEKYYQGLGVRKMAVPAPHEDAVSMAAEAAFSLVKNYNVDTDSIGMIIVGTETSVDAAKPISVYIHRMLGIHHNVRTFDTKHACYGGTAALRLAIDWCKARKGTGQKALVITTDIAKYDLGSPGEPTQGAGAVAMLVSDNPKLLSFDPHPEAVYTNEVMDFWRPHYRTSALVHGHESIECYLRALKTTYLDYQNTSGLTWEDYDYMLFHVPFPKIAYKGYQRLYDMEVPDQNGSHERLFNESFSKRARPALWANKRIGNLYSGSLYFSLAAILESGGKHIENNLVGLFSYGSGSCGEFFSGRIGALSSDWADKIKIEDALINRIELDYDGYRELRKESEAIMENDSFGKIALPTKKDLLEFSFVGIKDHERLYLDQEKALELISKSPEKSVHPELSLLERF